VLLTKRRELMEAWGAFAAQQPAPVTGDTTALPKQS
jgi:hypothetical protein